jgi:hypothetical protein
MPLKPFRLDFIAPWLIFSANRRLCAGGAIFELAGDVFDGRQGAEDMNFLVRGVDVYLQFALVRAYPDVLIVILNFNELRIRKLLQFFDDGVENGQGFARLLGGAAHLLARNEMHGHGDGRGWNPHMNVGAAGAEFVDVDADDAFAHGIGAREDERAAKSESCFRE